jgi:hypothetical protein
MAAIGQSVPVVQVEGQTGGDKSPYVPPTLASFNWDTVLSPQNFPRSLEDGKSLVSRATEDLKKRVQQIVDISDADRTFENTVMAYHDAMTAFDAAERLIRSERLIHDETPGKTELVGQCIQVKEHTFSDIRLQRVFLSFVERMRLFPVEWGSLKGIIQSIAEKHLPSEHLCDQGAPFAYLQGNSGSKVLQGTKKELSFLSANLCMMPEANSMIYGGVLPWPARVDAIAEELKRLDPDLLFLQEVYDVCALFELQKRLPSYAHFYGNAPLRLCGFSHASLYSTSGLAIISKFELENVRFERYSAFADEKTPGFERHGFFGFDRNYGIFHCDVKNGKETLAHLATTHENPFYADLREKQTRQIVESFAREAQQHPEVPSIICGDLNIERGDMGEGGERLIKEHFADHYAGGGPTWDDFGNFWFYKWHQHPERYVNPKAILSWTVDRSLLWSPWASSHPYTMTVERVCLHHLENPPLALTDHHGIMTRFTF